MSATMSEWLRLLHDFAWWPVCAVALWPAWELWRQTRAWRALRAMPAAPVRAATAMPAKRDADAPDHALSFAGVDVLLPIRSGDVGLGEALAASLRALGARGARLHWLIDEDDIVAGNVVRSLLKKHAPLAPHVAVSMHPSCPSGVNPKLFKLDRALAHCTGETVLILDDDAHLPPATLDALLAALGADHNASPVVATALPAYLPAQGLGARLLARFVNDNAALTYLPPRLTGGAPTLNGMCWAMRRVALLRIGGFAPWLRHLTDDLAMAQAVLRAGGRIDQRSEPVWMRTALPDFSAYRRQMHRWMLFALLLLRSQPWRMRLRILFWHGLPMLLPLLALVVFAYAPSWLGAAALALGATVHVLGRKRLQRACAGAATAKAEPLLSLASALLLPVHALHAMLDRRIYWRTHRYRVYANDRFVDCE
ncbi:MAG: glycosyltransferase [Lysobacter sp.]|nr:glycosyltransferase [Lysobacter sp.]